MAFSTYPYPPPPIETEHIDQAPITLLSLLPPRTPSTGQVPRLLSIQEAGIKTNRLPGFNLTRHVFPGAYPRSSISSTAFDHKTRAMFDPFGDVSGRGKERQGKIDRAARRAMIARHIKSVPRQEETLDQVQEPQLYLALNRFCLQEPESNATGKEPVTLVFYHANGFPKETWEPTMLHLLQHVQASDSKVFVDEIIAIDMYMHAESYLLNDGKIDIIVDWKDCARDLLSLLKHCMPPTASETPPQDVPEFLPFTKQTTPARKRRMVGIGHSVGGNAIIQAAHAEPDLFHSLIMVDPMTRIIEPNQRSVDSPTANYLGRSCVGRRNIWSSREEAKAEFLKSPFFRAWDNDVLDTFIQYGLAPLKRFPSEQDSVKEIPHNETGPIVLSTPRWAETALFCDGQGMFAGYDKLKWLRKDLKVTFVMAGDSTSTGGENQTHNMVWLPPCAENIIVDEAGHLITQEKPKELAEVMYRSLANVPLGGKPIVSRRQSKL